MFEGCDLKVVDLILGGLGTGLTIRAATAWVRKGLEKLLKVSIKGFYAYLVSVVCSAVGASAYLLVFSEWAWDCFTLYTALTFLAANGFYRVKDLKKDKVVNILRMVFGLMEKKG